MTECPTAGEPHVHPALAGRVSPVSFDPEATIPETGVDVLLDAARLAPSAGNSQPWMFVVGRRGDAIHARICRHLTPGSLRWAADASLLVVNIAHVMVEGTEWEYSEFARYDLGQAVAHMTVQALAMGLGAHQFRAFDRDGMAAEFAVPAEWEVTSVTAFGAAEATSATSYAGTSRQRLSLDEVTWARASAD
ncbi:nitroreductase family protein [Gordonia sp. DT219]|uniref:nitroreductase family protein n=1 Tax=Gordonia sp. DT219 TaxID=3416658 RepID=UPI003CEA743F